MKLFYLDNEHRDFIVMALDEDDAWRKLREHGILPYGFDDDGSDPMLSVAYNPLSSPLVDGQRFDNPNDLKIVL